MKMLSLLALLFAAAAWAEELPPGFSVPPEFREDATRRKYWAFDVAQFDYQPADARGMAHQKVEGHLWRTALTATAPQKPEGDAVVSAVASGFERDGWTILRRQGAFVARKAAAAGELWVSGSGSAGYFGLVLVQSARPARNLRMPAPQREIESVGDDRDLPYALPFPGASMQKGARDRRPFEIFLTDAKQSSYAVPFAVRWYALPSGVSSHEFAAVYRQALETAGWDVVRIQVAGDATALAHYSKNGRDVWLYTRADGSQQSISVADFGADTQPSRLKQQLGASGHVALYGIYFDTDSPLPRPESESTLRQVLELLTGNPPLRLEVQGNTDGTGTPEHNASLSAARAASVRKWLTEHGIADDRLTSKGYGATLPVADNRTPEGRAKNRRVEIASR